MASIDAGSDNQFIPADRSSQIRFWIVLGGLVIIVSVSSLFRFYSAGFFLHEEDICRHFYGFKENEIDFDVKALSDRVEEVLSKMNSLQALRQIRLPRVEGASKSTITEDPLINFFIVEEIRKYITPKKELEEYMNYDVGSYCKDDWNLAQRLMINGCDPLPRRRCLTRASKLYQKPYAINASLWRMPDDRNVRWSNYLCRNFTCLSSKNPKRGYSKCTGCFEMDKEKVKWIGNGSIPVDFSVIDVLAVKPGEIRIGLDYGIGTGTFAARMREQNVTIVSTALNLGAPFNEMIALRGLVPLYATLNQRLPFFDNTMDLIHTSGFLDGWIDLQLMDFILFDWDRILRPGGLLWVDRFFCSRKDLDDYMYMFLQFRYKKHKWVVSPKSKDEVYLSALLEKPPSLRYGVLLLEFYYGDITGLIFLSKNVTDLVYRCSPLIRLPLHFKLIMLRPRPSDGDDGEVVGVWIGR
ncbi:hypothetical protein Syun_028861 [Stephania yunnanensis]|uniref:Methyltransferase type 11 domain-containing protein n=1 Tax=Stephania yunnanensis TaxID=152371 RepID=A0AAP0E7V6_9MAGN